MAAGSMSKRAQARRGSASIKPNKHHRNNNKYKDYGEDSGRCTNRKLFFLGVLISMSAVAIGFYLISSKTPKMRMSQILRQNVDVCEQLLAHEIQLSRFLLEDPLIELIKTRMRPVLERIASIRTQTSQYEKMEHVPGGPTNFMMTTQKELDRIEFEQLLLITLEAARLLKENQSRGISLAKSSNKIVQTNAALLDDDSIRMLIYEGIFITPVNQDPEYFNKTGKGFVFEDILKLYSDLAAMYERLEETAHKMETLRIEHGIEDLEEWLELEPTEPTDLLNIIEVYSNYREQITKEISVNERFYQLLSPFKSQTNKNIMAMLGRVFNYELEKRGPYLKLHEMALEDIRQLRIRIQNLKYKYAKKSTEL